VRLLLDSHALIWAVDDPSRLGYRAASELANPANDLFLSAGTIWEIAIKVGLKKLALSLPFKVWMTQAVADLGLVVLPITVESADAQTALPSHHRDPFDRLLVAQAKTENIVLVSTDVIFDQYGTQRLW
jgi:PIN domain nuclease of toxin-antitoxin system